MAPFTLGLGMVGKFGNIRGENLKPIVALVITKSILTPILTHFLVEQMSLVFTGSKDPALSNFGFLYGTFPTALGVDSYAGQYNVNPDLISAAIVLCTLFSAPLMYVAANILTVLDVDHCKPDEFPVYYLHVLHLWCHLYIPHLHHVQEISQDAPHSHHKPAVPQSTNCCWRQHLGSWCW